MATIARICRYPVKGLSVEELPQVQLRVGEGLPLDRAFALARPAAPLDPANPKWLPKRHFLMLMRDERLASLRVAYDDAEGRLTISQAGREALAASVLTPDGRDAIERFFEGFMGPELGGRPRLVRASGHTFTDHATPYLSLINLASVRELERTVGRPVTRCAFAPISTSTDCRPGPSSTGPAARSGRARCAAGWPSASSAAPRPTSIR